MNSIIYVDKLVTQSQISNLGIKGILKDSALIDSIEEFQKSNVENKYYVDSYINYKDRVNIINSFRDTGVKCYISINPDQLLDAFNSVNPTKPYRFLNSNHPSSEFEIYDVTSRGDWRFSPFFMKYEDSNIENYYQLVIKGYGLLGYTHWKEVKGNPPLEFIPVNHIWTRSEVEHDKDYLYIFTDNLNRSSGKNVIDHESWYYKKYFNGSELKYPTMTQAVIRGLNNAYPISTMKTQFSNQLTESDEIYNTWDKEIEAIIQALKSGNYKGIKFSGRTFGNGQYSRITGKLRTYLDSSLLRIGINNTSNGAVPNQQKNFRGGLLGVFQVSS